MKFSLIVPTYNRCHILWKCLLSIRNQSYPHFEVVIADDGSTDQTMALVKEFQTDSRFIYKRKVNGGASSARNFAREFCTGDIIVYIDSDEELYSNFLEKIKLFIESHPHKKFGNTRFNFVLEQFDDDFNLVESNHLTNSQLSNVEFEDILNWRSKTCGTGIFHKSEVNTRWDENIKLLEDLDFIISMGEDYPNDFLHIPYILFEYRQRYKTDGQCSLSSYEDFANGFKTIYDKHNGKVYELCEKAFMGRYKKYRSLNEKFLKDEIPAMNEYIFDRRYPKS